MKRATVTGEATLKVAVRGPALDRENAREAADAYIATACPDALWEWETTIPGVRSQHDLTWVVCYSRRIHGWAWSSSTNEGEAT